MLGTSPESKGGIGTVVKGYAESVRPKNYSFDHIVTHADLGIAGKIAVAGKAYCRCLGSLSKRNYDLVHIHSAFGASFDRSIPFIKLASKRGVPVVNLIHSDDWEAFYLNASQSKKKTIESVYGLCDRVIVLSDEWRDCLASVVPVERLAVLENFTPVYEEDFWPDWDAKTIVFMSRLEQIKGCNLLPDICESVLQRVPDSHFLICGNGSMKEELARELHRRSIDRQVELVGWVDGIKKTQMLKRASLFLLPSYGEGMPMCVLEAMGLGLPIVATEVGGLPQLITNGQNGLLCAPGDADGIANSIVGILSASETLAAMGAVSKERAYLHSFGPYSEKLKAIYDSVLEEVRW